MNQTFSLKRMNALNARKKRYMSAKKTFQKILKPNLPSPIYISVSVMSASALK